ncbi:protein UmuD-like protein [Klebsiella pneumoniae]|nr:protein UmuD-like protein [Klebsiella pneumoniae]
MSARSSYTTRTEGYSVGFPSPASDYVEGRLTVDKLCSIGPNTRLFERSGGYVVLDISLMPSQGSQVLIQHGGGTELATLRGRSLITEDGEAIEGEALDDVSVIGVVTFTICDVRQDNAVV